MFTYPAGRGSSELPEFALAVFPAAVAPATVAFVEAADAAEAAGLLPERQKQLIGIHSLLSSSTPHCLFWSVCSPLCATYIL